MVGMYTLSKDSIRIRNKNKGNRKRNKKVNFRNSVEESSYEHVGLSSNNSNQSSLPEFSDTLNNSLTHWMTLWHIERRSYRIKRTMSDVPKKTDHRPPQYKFREKQVLKPSADCSK